jgi:hypothetical protein
MAKPISFGQWNTIAATGRALVLFGLTATIDKKMRPVAWRIIHGGLSLA